MMASVVGLVVAAFSICGTAASSVEDGTVPVQDTITFDNTSSDTTMSLSAAGGWRVNITKSDGSIVGIWAGSGRWTVVPPPYGEPTLPCLPAHRTPPASQHRWRACVPRVCGRCAVQCGGVWCACGGMRGGALLNSKPVEDSTAAITLGRVDIDGVLQMSRSFWQRGHRGHSPRLMEKGSQAGLTTSATAGTARGPH
jgi:hypothetical protein